MLAIEGGPKAVHLDPEPAWPSYEAGTVDAVAELLRRGESFDYGSGELLLEFERRFADHFNTAFAVAMGSGTAALHSAYAATVLSAGDEVVVPAYGFHATVAPLFLCNAIPVLCDVDEVTGNLDPAVLPTVITDRTRAVVVSHMWGHPADMEAISAVCAEHELLLIEDCSHAHGATYRGVNVGGIGHIGATSLGARKMISGGLGGVLSTNSDEIRERALVLGHNHERTGDEVATSLRDRSFLGWGANHRITPVSAMLCLHHLESLPERIKVKQDRLGALDSHLASLDGIDPPATSSEVTRGAWYGYKAQYDAAATGVSMERVLAALQAEGVDADRPTNRPFTWFPGFQSTEGDPPYYAPGRQRPCYDRADAPGANSFYERSLSLPAPLLSEASPEFIDQYCEAFSKVFENLDRLN